MAGSNSSLRIRKRCSIRPKSTATRQTRPYSRPAATRPRALGSRTLAASVGEISISDDRRQHWEQVYATRQAEKLGWYRPRLETSLAWIMALHPGPRSSIIDVGGGASTLVDDLVDEGFESITVLDIADTALEVSRQRLGHQAELVMWLSGDITEYQLPASQFDIWHDRAVLHFLTDPADRDAYVDNLHRALKPGGQAIIGLFAPEAPPKCSGLPVQRYDEAALAEVLGSAFELLEHHKERHTTPGGIEQMYLYCRFRRSDRP